MSQTVFYARVSTKDQNFTHQKDQAEAAGFTIDKVVSDHGVSGIHTRLSERSEGKRLFDILRSGDVLVVRWVDHLGRNYEDVTDTIRDFMRRGIIIKTVINKMTFDGATKDPMQAAVRDALIAFMAATAQAQAEATKEAQRAGIEAAKDDQQRYRGKKPSYDRKTYQAVIDRLALGEGASSISKATGLTRQTVLRIRDKPETAEAALSKWNI
ncbi:recombinase family protein [Loktanella sp. F6476L]|uniref:recombinase family protein n=1 Tax=Loktanella sp. F6476L TaxID=2926405 RepID=UPI001FF286C0|nr:recombinase family protein [Loktanella sp. F6476L]MCK0120254.1 recombinase family protein [Loktanella sp. F6476L]